MVPGGDAIVHDGEHVEEIVAKSNEGYGRGIVIRNERREEKREKK